MVKLIKDYHHNPNLTLQHRKFFPPRLAFLLVLLTGLILGGVVRQDMARLEVSAAQAPNTPVSIAHLAEIPIAVHRRAAQHLEDMRFSEMATGWERAALGENVRVLYRPDDLQTPAYYEVSVIIPGSNNSPAGFIILAANENDFPISHWDSFGSPPTYILDEEAENLIQAYYKLDTLSYVAEDTKGNIAARLGQLPPKIEGMSMEWLDREQELGESAWIPDNDAPEDEEESVISGTLIFSGTVTPPPELVITEWESWGALKEGYTESYGVFLEHQKREASDLWQAELADQEYGIVLVKEQIHDMAMLWPDPVIALDGPGVEYITPQTVSQGSELPLLFRVTVAGDVPLGFTPFTATISYGNGVQETARFQIVERYSVHLPLVLLNHHGSVGAIATTAISFKGQPEYAPSAISGWGPWHYFWAGTHSAQRLYNQMPASDPQNLSGCWSGCGATAWAMLFGWADNQAATGNAYWAGRWGIYRQNGGYGADAVAPQYWDTGVKNMIWEIRQRIGTFCAFGSGATAPWDMSGASGYLANRTGTRLSTRYNAVGISTGGLRERARDSIIYRNTPAVIGTGWLNHYPLAYGYAWRSKESCVLWWCSTSYSRYFYVNQGWGGNGNGWVSASTWFAGEIRP